MSALTQTVKARVDEQTKRAVENEAKRTQRTEGAVIRLALQQYLAARP